MQGTVRYGLIYNAFGIQEYQEMRASDDRNERTAVMEQNRIPQTTKTDLLKDEIDPNDTDLGYRSSTYIAWGKRTRKAPNKSVSIVTPT